MVEKILLISREDMSMTGEWINKLYCSILPDNSLSLAMVVEMDGERECGHTSSGESAIDDINTPKEFCEALGSFADAFGDWEDQDELDELFVALFAHKPKFALASMLYRKFCDDFSDDFSDEVEALLNLCPDLFLTAHYQTTNDFHNDFSRVSSALMFCVDRLMTIERFPEGDFEFEGLKIHFKINDRALVEDKMRLLRISKLIEGHVDEATFDRSLITGTPARLAMGEFRYKIRIFVEQYLEDHTTLPTGTHLVDSIPVTFNTPND